jgi:diaminopimelate epimerase
VSELHFVKGHGTENDFIIIPDANGVIDLSDSRVRALCDRRAGLGADGVIRVVRTDACEDPTAVAARDEALWFMDYRNADGSLSQMCGNGVRVMALYLATHADVDLRNQLLIATRGGIKRIDFDGANITVDMGEPVVKGESNVGVGAKSWSSRHVDMGNPHAVAFVESLEDAGDLREAPQYDAAVYPEGVNIEFVTRVGDHHVAMRVHERGVGETRSCGTGACAAGVAAALADGAERGETYVVDVPGGALEVTWTADDRVLLSGPAVLVAEGTVDL